MKKYQAFGDSKITVLATLYFSHPIDNKDSIMKNKLNIFYKRFSLEEDEFEFNDVWMVGNALLIRFTIRPNLAITDIMNYFIRHFSSWILADKSLRKKYAPDRQLFTNEYKVEVSN